MIQQQRLRLPLFGLIALVAIMVGVVSSVQAQVRRVVTGGTFTPGSQVLFATDFSQDAPGNFPAGLRYLSGPLEVVQVEGVNLLRSIGHGEFIIPLAQALPQDFTLEFELIARNSNCCAGEELAFEGSPQLSRTSGSAQVLWHHQYLAILGGGQDMGTSTVRFSEDLQSELLGQRALIQVMMSGTQFKLFTNGRQISNVPNLQFRRSTVLRVFLGGLDDGDRAVYLARVRLAASGPAGTVASNPSPAPAPAPAVTAPAPQTYELQVSVTPGQAGPVVQWNAIPGSTYRVTRSAEGNRGRAASPTLTNVVWFDSALPVPGKYVYQVTATSPTGEYVGTAAFTTRTDGTLANTPVVATLQVSVVQGQDGPVAQWTAIQEAKYSVRRVGPNNCCYAVREGLTDPIWFDAPVPGPGTYVYEVTATSPQGGKVGFGTTQFVSQAETVDSSAALESSSAAPAPAPPAAQPATPPQPAPVPPPSPAPAPAPAAAPATAPAGPATTEAVMSPVFGWGVMVAWSPVASATAYRVYRTESPTVPGTLLATISSADAAKGSPDPSMLWALDPDVIASSSFGSYTSSSLGSYWVEAVFADGSISTPGPAAAGRVEGSWTIPSGTNLKVSVGGLKQITLPDGGQSGGYDFTWSWDLPAPNTPRAYIYYVAVLYSSGSPGPLGGTSNLRLYHAETLRISESPPFPIMIQGAVPGPPYTLGFPGGMVPEVTFCVSQLPIGRILAGGGDLSGWGAQISCLMTKVP